MAYIYRHIRLDKNEPFYIGIGSDSLGKFSRAKSKSRNSIWKNIVSKTEYNIEIILDDLSWEEACLKEKEFISIYGKIYDNSGILANITDGGDGTLGTKWSKERHILISKKMKGRISPMKGKVCSKEHKQKVSLSKKGIPRPKYVIEALRNANIGRAIPREQIEKGLETKRTKYPDGVITSKYKLVLNVDSGIYYNSIKEAAESIPMKWQTLQGWLTGRYKNKSNMILC